MAEAGDTRKIKFVLMKEHPLLGYALSFMIGAYIALSNTVPRLYCFAALGVLTLCVLVLTILRKKSWFVFVFIFLISGYLLSDGDIPKWYKQDYIPPEECRIVGTVESLENTDYSREYVLSNVSIGMDEIESKVKIKNITQSNYVQVGDTIKLKVVLEKPAVAQMNGMFSEARYYMTKDIQYLATVFAPRITRLKSDETVASVNTKWQEKIYSNLQVNFDQPVLGLIYSISTGNKDYMDKEIYSKCADLGIAHIFAISGLHIGALLVVWEFYCKKRKKRFLVKILGSAVLVAVLYLIVGSRASLLRAISMWALIVVYNYLGIKGDLIDFLALAMLGLLFINPLYVIDLGFILSVTCVGAIALVYTPIMRKFKGSKLLNFYPVSMFMVSLAILSFSWVITARAFNQVAVLSPVWNVVFVPMAIVLLTLILLYSLTFYIPFLSTALIWVIDKLASVIVKLVQGFSEVNIDIDMPDISFFESIGLIALFLFITDTLFKERKGVRIAVGLVGIAAILSAIFFLPAGDKMEVFAGYDTPFVYISEDDESIVILNECDGGIERVLEDIDAEEVDLFIYSGNEIEDLEELLEDLEDVCFDEIIAHKDLMDDYRGDYNLSFLESGEQIEIGEVRISLVEFRANKKAITHYYADIDYYDRNFIYLDPIRLREGAIDDCEIVISSSWTKQRIEYVVFADSKYVIMNSRDYRMDDCPISAENTTIPTYNINNSGSFTYFPKGER